MAASLELARVLSTDRVLHVTLARGYVLRASADVRPNALADAELSQLVDGVAAGLRPLIEAKPVGMILHLRESLPVWGPLSIDSLGRAIALACGAGVPVAVTVSEDPLQRLQLSRLCAERGGPLARAVPLDHEAVAFVRGGEVRDPWAVSTGVRATGSSAPPRVAAGRKSRP